MPRPRRFAQVDVFTAKPLLGNPVAVILDADGLSDAEMQQVALWTNLSETTFVLSATEEGADYRVRIFTPQTELPFAGHPTLGTAHAVIEAGIATPKDRKLVQQCEAGLVEVMREGQGLSFRLPRQIYLPVQEPEALIATFGEAVVLDEPAVIDVGPHWVIARLASVEDFAPDLPALAAYNIHTGTTGLTVYAEIGGGEIAVRSYAPTDGIAEDPVCGSGNGAVAVHRMKHAGLGDGSAYVARQGQFIGRDGEVRVRIEGNNVHVGGECVTCIEGTFLI